MTETTTVPSTIEDDEPLLDQELIMRFLVDTVNAASTPPSEEDLEHGYARLIDLVTSYGMVACWLDGDVDLIWDVDRGEIVVRPKKTVSDN